MSDERNKGGRQTKLTPELQDQILALVRDGNFVSTVAGLVGIHRDTLYGWLERGEAEKPSADDEAFVAFAIAYRKAEAEAEVASGIVARQPGEKGKGERWFMERRWPDRYGKRLRTEITGADGGPVKVSVDAEQLLAKIEALAAEAPAGTRSSNAGIRGEQSLPSGESRDPAGS